MNADDLINKIVLIKEINYIDTKRHYRFNDVINHGGLLLERIY